MNQDPNKDSAAVNAPAADNRSSASDYTHISDTGSAEVLQYNVDTAGDKARVRGVVRNNSGELLSPVEITVVLLDGAGQVVAQQNTFPGNAPDFAMAPGQKAGFNVEFDLTVDDFATTRISVYSEPADERDDMPRSYSDLEVTGVQLGEKGLNGIIRNTGQQAATDLLVSVVLYDRKSRVISAGEATVEDELLGPGEETTFAYSQADGNADTWDVVATARGENA